MNYEMRRKDRQTTQREAEQLLRDGEYGILSTVGADGIPYGVPLSYAFADGRLYVHCAAEGRKLDALRACGQASFCVVGATQVLPAKFSTNYESVIAAGPVRELDGVEKAAALTALVEKYAPDFSKEGAAYIDSAMNTVCVLCMEPAQITGKARR